MQRMLRPIIPLVAAICCSGCVVLPIPNYQLHEHGVSGRIMAKDDRPIAGATISCDCPNGESTKSDSDGYFHLQSESGWHGGMLIGIMVGGPIWPTLHEISDERVFTVSAPGYRARHIVGWGSRPDGEFSNTLAAIENGDDFDVERIYLIPEESSETHSP